MNLLFDNELLVVNPKLATLIGLNEAIILQQMHYWIGKTNNSHDGKKWIYNSVSEWAKQFPFFSESTIARTIKHIEKKGLVFVGNYNKDGRDRTKWYSIDYTKLDEFEQIAFSQNDGMQTVNMTECNQSNCGNASTQNDAVHSSNMSEPLPETTTETTANILLSGNSDKFPDDAKLKRFFHKNPDAHVYTASGKKWGNAKDLECAQWIYEKLLIVNPTAVEPNWICWANDIRLLRTQVLVDHFDNPHKEICRRFKIANLDNFWKDNIQCPATLRKHWDKFHKAPTQGKQQGVNWDSTGWATGSAV